ncbi:hypothetical protein PW52_08075 [Tamlana sedimentorum]|uniref:Uncharacterized protein n=1 Tax=Neotamlana sedimentorum TaxID=1435349 RepID=A0A0D7W990_9FLAO|nr:pyrimidine/purine nucleoside phosphorylase [Tamlana sedimentorum]KJD35691.1 hypothetical protein PW52_08075 [Tamlana sedimentorum]
MIQVNEYFDGKVKSLSLKNTQGNFTIGVLTKGTYEFSTTTKEWMTLTAGKWEIELPNSSRKAFGINETCDIPSGITFTVYALEDSAYLCKYE